MYDDWDEDLDFTISEGEQYLLFTVHETLLALPSTDVVEIVEFPIVTPIPLAHPSVLGVANIRGNIIAIVDTAKRVWDHSTPISKRTSLIIIRIESEESLLLAGIVVDEILEVESMLETNFITPPAFGLSIDKEYVASIARYKEEYLIILEPKELLNLEVLSQIKEIR